METISLAEEFGEAVFKASGALRRGGVIIYPTDTLYGLGADAFSDTAVDAVYALKGREAGKPMHMIVADIAMAEEYGEINDGARRLAEAFLPGALTLIVNKKPHVTGGIARGMDTIGFRIPDHEFCIALAKTFGKPYTATSANRVGQTSEPSVERILEQFGADAEKLEFVIDAGDLPLSPPSTVVNICTGAPVVLREGAISREEIGRLFTV